MANYLLTGAAGFIGSRVAAFLLDAGHTVYGVDNINDAYDVRLKHFRLSKLLGREGFHFRKWDLSEKSIIDRLSDWLPGEVQGLIHLAAWAGTRRSLTNPWIYVDTNVTGTLNMLELCRQKSLPKLVMASTSSVYGGSFPTPIQRERRYCPSLAALRRHQEGIRGYGPCLPSPL